MHANKQNPKEMIEAGDICAVQSDLRISGPGIHFVIPRNPLALETMDFPDPVISIAVEPKTQDDIDKLGMALGKLTGRRSYFPG